MADTYTTNLNLTKPQIGGDTDTWGTLLNNNFDSIDALFGSAGTAPFNGKVAVGGSSVIGPGKFSVHQATNVNLIVQTGTIDATGAMITASNDAYTAVVPLAMRGSYLSFINNSGNEVARFDTSGNMGIGTGSPVAISTYPTLDIRGSSGGGLRYGNATAHGYLYADAGGVQIGSATNNVLAFYTNATQRAVIDSSGNLGIGSAAGVTSGRSLDINGVTLQPLITMRATSLTSATTDWTLDTTNSLVSFDSSNWAMRWNVNGAERMRIDSGGHLLVGATSGGSYSSCAMTLSTNSGTTKWDMGPYSTATNFLISSGTGGVVLSGTATSWSALSDARSKTALTPFGNAAQKVCTLRAGTGRYLTDEERVSRSFLIAQDVLEVLPEAVDVSDDEQKSLMLRYTDLIPLLTAAIQEQQATIQQLTARIEAVEAKP